MHRQFPARPLRHCVVKLLLAGFALAAAGCDLVGPKLNDYGVSGAAVELSSVPFFSQDDYQCAPAALATVLAARQVPVKLDELIRQVSVAGRTGSLQAEVVAATRSYGLVPYVLHSPHLDLDVVHEVQAGNAVMVLQNRGFSFAARWHFAVVAGVDPQNNTLILRSGTQARETLSYGAFISAWRDGGNWAMVAMKPEQLPATVDAENWLTAVAPFEQLGKADVAERAYAAATQRWPDNALAWEALANARHAQNNFVGSSQALTTALQLSPQNTVARNNLAYVLLERNCADQAEGQIAQAIAAETDPKKVEIFQRTRRQIMLHDGPSVVCPGL
ncbi:MAG: tetratricopeptide repeat protein [Nevskia sp.]|nr:tetratricopeptide repeat protein [Nevskia sp.]